MGRRDAGLTLRDLGEWVDNDEGLYNWWRNSKLAKREFIRQNRAELSRIVRAVLDGERRPHYLVYGG